MYKVFNPLTGFHQDAADQDAAQRLWANLVSEAAARFQEQPRIQGRYLYNPDWAASFDVAWAFYCAKQSLPVSDALETEGTIRLYPTHSVFNTSTGAVWSHTFEYVSPSAQTFHIKVHDGQVTDWYEKRGTYNGQVYEWVAFNLETGVPIEVYELTGERTLTKRSLLDASAATVETHFMPYHEMPAEVQAAAANVPSRESITAYSEKSYGLIVEYNPSVFVPETDWPTNIKFQLTNLLEQAIFAARAKAKEAVTVNLVVTNEDGSETWNSVVFN